MVVLGGTIGCGIKETEDKTQENSIIITDIVITEDGKIEIGEIQINGTILDKYFYSNVEVNNGDVTEEIETE